MDDPLKLAALKFPFQWHTRLIVAADCREVDEAAIHSIFAGFGLQAEEVALNTASSSGKYASWKLSCTIPDYAIFRGVVKALQEMPGFVMLL